jgi:hypothetical protein
MLLLGISLDWVDVDEAVLWTALRNDSRCGVVEGGRSSYGIDGSWSFYCIHSLLSRLAYGLCCGRNEKRDRRSAAARLCDDGQWSWGEFVVVHSHSGSHKLSRTHVQ